MSRDLLPRQSQGGPRDNIRRQLFFITNKHRRQNKDYQNKSVTKSMNSWDYESTKTVHIWQGVGKEEELRVDH